MRVYLPNSKDPKTGKGLFIKRLSKALSKYVDIVDNPDTKHDVALHLLRIKKKTNSSFNVIRYDGVYHNTTQDFKTMNADISRGMKKANGVIYQSKFSKIMCDRYLGVFNGPQKIIFNGIDVSSFNPVKPIATLFKTNILAASRWRPHKRLREIIECFLLADISNSCLWVAGDLDQCGMSAIEIKSYKKNKNIKFLGYVKPDMLMRYYKLCQMSVHLCWFDCCPNSVIEAIAGGCTVISNNVGGTPELVSRSNGIICNIDKSYNLKPVDLYHPPKINRSIVAEAMRRNRSKITSDFIDIKIIAKQYFDFFKLRK